ncbi:type II/IV secretion system ATPase subunit [Halorientalis pallida]|uniref:type II/IV secretion system ATPase subunit n=1 Tax=Halorientalis pallida TaxID=2479928 RepID=UPI003C6ED2CF
MSDSDHGDEQEAVDWSSRVETEEAALDETSAGPPRPPEGEEPMRVTTDEPAVTTPGDPREEVTADVIGHFESATDLVAPQPDESFLRDSFFDFEYADRYHELERYWVNKPFAYVSIVEDQRENDERYHVVEPTLSTFEDHFRADMITELREVLLHVPREDDPEETLSRELAGLANRYAADADPGSIHKVHYYITRDLLGYDAVDPLMRDRQLEDISCDGTNVPVYVYHRGYRDLETNVRFDREALNSLIIRLAQRSDKHISVAEPMVDASLPEGSRIQMTLGEEVSSRGSNFTIRRFAEVPLTPIDLIQWGTFSVETMTYLWLAIENNLSLIFAGGTASGKTTSMNAVSMFVPRKSKVISIEDTREITLPHDNWIQSVTREGFEGGRGEIGMYELLQAALRQRPEYLLVGEIRTEQDVALAFFQAMATGHTAYTTMHADSTETVLSRLQNPPLSVPEQMVRELDIVAIQRQLFLDDRRVRRNVGISEFFRDPDGGTEVRDVYEWQPGDDEMASVEPSGKLREVMRMRGWDESDLAAELGRRERLLRHMVTEDIADYETVSEVLWRFDRDPEAVLERVEDGTLAELGTDD